MFFRILSLAFGAFTILQGSSAIAASLNRTNVNSSIVRPDRLRSAAAVENRFAEARGLNLRDADIDFFIDSRITGVQRKIAHSILAAMPPNLRGDFLYLEPNGEVLSNNLALLPYAKVQFTAYGRAHSTSAANSKPSSDARFRRALSPGRLPSKNFAASPSDYISSCSPPNPPGNPMGAYVRLVSPCGFTTGWGFINIPTGDSYMAPNDTGDAYFELQGPRGNAVEGGLEYYSDASIAPYLRSSTAGSGGFITMTNNSNRYFAGEILGIFHGLTPNISTLGGTGNLAYTLVGALSSTQNPQTDFVDSIVVQLVNPSWLFYTAPSDMTGAGVDAAGVSTACSYCSISQVTSIAQNGIDTYGLDGSYFGVDLYGNDTIQWLQVAFGEWTSACAPGASVCPFASSANPLVYYGGPHTIRLRTFLNPMSH